MNSFGVLQALVFEPKKAFAELAERPRFVFPLLVLIICAAGLVLWYYRVVDLEWLIDQQVRGSGRGSNLSDAQVAAMVKTTTAHPGVIAAVSILGAAFLVVVLRMLEAMYYMLAGKITNVQRGFAQWLSLASWSSLPALLAVIPAAVALATASSAQIDQSALQPLSLNAVLFHRLPSEPGYTLFTNFNLLQLLGFYLAAYGVRAWSGRSWLFSILFALLPEILFYGGWAVIALGRS